VRATTLFEHKSDNGSERLANGGEAVNYGNGRVGEASDHRDGERGVAVASGGTRSGSFNNRDEQILLTSRLYEYPTALSYYDQREDDEDAAISPYIRMDYELIRHESVSFSAGLSYSFTSAELDTGTNLASLDHAYERVLNHYFLYNVDYQDGQANSNRVIVNDAELATNPVVANDAALNGATARGPQTGMQGTSTEKGKVATFVHNGLDVDMHSISLPFAMTLDLGERLHVSLEAGPTLNILNYDLRTEAWSQSLSNTSGQTVLGKPISFKGNNGVFTSSDFKEADTTIPPPAMPYKGGATGPGVKRTADLNVESIVATSPDKQPPAGRGTPSGGKGGNYRNPALPGDTIANRVWREEGVRARFGAFAQLGVQYDLNDADTWFIDVWGRYDYVGSFTISNGITSANIDPSAWSIGAGIGYRF
jgi:hypothetical protein